MHLFAVISVITLVLPPACNGQTRIIGGQEVKDRVQYPSIVRLSFNGCSGVILNEKWIISVSHCIGRGQRGGYVHAGRIDLSGNDGHEQSVPIMRIIKHEKYRDLNKLNDVALIRVKELKFSPYVQPVVLPDTENYGSIDSKNVTAWAVGWGKTTEQGNYPHKLRHVEVPLINPGRCEEIFTPGGIKYVREAMICAGYREGGKDACQGDSGGPFFYKVPGSNTSVLIGLVSWGVGCGRANVPGVYTRVSNYLDWIKKNSAVSLQGFSLPGAIVYGLLRYFLTSKIERVAHNGMLFQ